MKKESVRAVSSLDKEIQDKFSGSWHIYRVSVHEKGGMMLAAEFMSDRYSVRTLFNTLEMLDMYDAMKEQAAAFAKTNKQK